MSKSKNLINKLAKFAEEGMVNSKDFGDEIKNALRLKKEEMLNNLNFVTKEEFEIQKARLEKLEIEIKKIKKIKSKR
tara:strand:+ start:321 stop:551 length:231 start_codon:yes stop_codon:yes gene_type:complete